MCLAGKLVRMSTTLGGGCLHPLAKSELSVNQLQSVFSLHFPLSLMFQKRFLSSENSDFCPKVSITMAS